MTAHDEPPLLMTEGGPIQAEKALCHRTEAFLLPCQNLDFPYKRLGFLEPSEIRWNIGEREGAAILPHDGDPRIHLPDIPQLTRHTGGMEPEQKVQVRMAAPQPGTDAVDEPRHGFPDDPAMKGLVTGFGKGLK